MKGNGVKKQMPKVHQMPNGKMMKGKVHPMPKKGMKKGKSC